MSKRAIILHGTMGSPESNWFRWLEAVLVGRGYEVWLPTLPDAEQPSLREWADFIAANTPFPLDDHSLIIGHSSGAVLALILAQEAAQPIGAIVAVSIFRDNVIQWQPNNRLFDVSFDFPRIQTGVRKLLFIHSDNDPYGSLEKTEQLADSCAAELVVVSGEGHFNLDQSPAYKTFPKLLELLGERQLL
jgi:uncharacterized protein